jgi:hypothetical protein
MPDNFEQFAVALRGLLRELANGPADAAFVLNRGDRGLLASLEEVSAQTASLREGWHASVAAHVDHLRYGLNLLNRWARGQDPWRSANYAESWKRTTVSADQWRVLRDSLAAEVRQWDKAIAERRDWNRESLTEAMASVIHLAYHIGAIRQLAHEASGPPATD